MFFGHPYDYNVLTVLAEGAALLLFRRTTAIGVIQTLAALANEIAGNYSFDVHAKMRPANLFIMAFFLFLRDGRTIALFFFIGKTIPFR